MTGLGLTLVAVLGASVVGSLHCVGMCGGFVAAVSGSCQAGPGAVVSDPSSDRKPSTRLAKFGPLFAYQAARGLAYTVLGALAGLLGAGLDAGASSIGFMGIQRVTGPLMGIVLIAMAVSSIHAQLRTGASGPSGPGLVSIGSKMGSRARRRGLLDRLRLHLTKAVREHGARAGAAAGLLTALLPCGWLWAYVAVAASTGSVTAGLLVMATFWLGSVPALLAVGLLAGELGRRLGRLAPRITAALLLGLGILSLAGKLTLVPPAPTQDAKPTVDVPHDAPCH